jgi:AraC-like DNA-binding protein
MLLYLTISTLALSLLLLINNYKKNKNAIYVGLFLIIVSLYGITHYFVLFGQSPFWLALFYNHFTPLYLLLGPLLFFYIRVTLTDCASLFKKDYFHFIPALIQAVGIFPYLLTPFEIKLQNAERIINNIDSLLYLNLNLFYNADVSFLIRVGLFLIYIMYCGYLLISYAPIIRKENAIPNKQYKVSLKWLTLLVVCSFIITLYLLTITVLSFYSSPKEAFANSYALHLISGFSYFILSFSLLLFPYILYGMPRKIIANDRKFNKEPKNIPADVVNEIIPEEDPLFELSEKIITYLNDKKPFLDPEFSISTIAIIMQVPQNHVSYCINTLQSTTFYRLRAELRVKHAISLLQSETKDRLTIEAIGEQSGFKTRSNFYMAFKECTGMTPTEFISLKPSTS